MQGNNGTAHGGTEAASIRMLGSITAGVQGDRVGLAAHKQHNGVGILPGEAGRQTIRSPMQAETLAGGSHAKTDCSAAVVDGGLLAVFAYGELFPVCFHPGLAQVLIQRAPAIEGLPGAVTGGLVRLQARRSQGQQGGVDGGGLHQMRTMFQQTGIQLGLGEGGIVEHPAQEGGVMVDALQLQGVQCLNQLLPGGVAVCAVTDQLGDHGIVVFVHAIALFVARIDSALIVGPAQVAQQAGGGQEPLFRVFRIETDFHGGAVALNLVLLFGQWFPGCH